jgi:hypothetical protein
MSTKAILEGFSAAVRGDWSRLNALVADAHRTATDCHMCEGRVFVADVEEDGNVVWSHLEDTGCDDPVPT